MAGTFPQTWSEVALVTVMLKGGTRDSHSYQFAATTETIDISEPDFTGETAAKLVSGGRIWKETVHPEEDGEITLEMYPVKIDVADEGGLFQHYGGQQWGSTKQWDSTQPLVSQSDDGTQDGNIDNFPDGVYVPRERFLVAIMWTDDTAVDDATDATTTVGTVGLRFWAKECRLVSIKSAFTDGVLKSTATFRFPAANKQGDKRNFAWESTNDGNVSPLAVITYA